MFNYYQPDTASYLQPKVLYLKLLTQDEHNLQLWVNRNYKNQNTVMTCDNYQMNQCQWSEPTSVSTSVRMAGPQPKHM